MDIAPTDTTTGLPDGDFLFRQPPPRRRVTTQYGQWKLEYSYTYISTHIRKNKNSCQRIKQTKESKNGLERTQSNWGLRSTANSDLCHKGKLEASDARTSWGQ